MSTATLNGVELYYEIMGTGPKLFLTHGSWTDGSGWAQLAELLADRYEVVTWDRRGHSRSADTDEPGSRTEDATDLAALIEHLGDLPVHLLGNSYGATVTLTVVTQRPDLVASAVVHEPPLFTLLEDTSDPAILEALATSEDRLDAVAEFIEAGHHRDAAKYFFDNVAFGPGTWDRLPESFHTMVTANAATYLDELHDPTGLSIDTTALASTTVPILLTHGTTSPPLFSRLIGELTRLLPSAQVEAIDGAGHIPYATHPHQLAAVVSAFHQSVA